MKILILTPSYPRKGATMNGIFIHQQVKALQQLGAECHVLLLHTWFPPFGLHKYHPYWRNGHKERQAFFDEFEGVKIHSIPMFIKMPTGIFKESFFDRAVRSVVKYIKSKKQLRDADWIYAHFLTDMGYIAAKTKEELNIKVAAITRGDDVHAWPESNPALIDNIKYCLSHADLMLANNMQLAKDALKFADSIRPEFGIVYNGIDYKEFCSQLSDGEILDLRIKYKLPLDKKILICVARNEYLKGWNELLEAISENRNMLKDWVLLAITGEEKGRYSIDIKQKVAALDIADKVLVKNFMPFEEVKQLYKATNAFILPSYNEGISNAVMEAMASGLWVITTKVGGHSEIIEHGKSGYLILPRSKGEIANSLNYLIDNYDNQRSKVAIEGYKAMERLGNYSDNAKKLINYFLSK